MRTIGLVLLVASCIVVFAQDQSSAEAVDVQVQDHETYGAFLVDGEGRSLYAYENDSAGISTCLAECLEAWPAATVDGEPTAGTGVAGSLLGTITRADGTSQLTYSGRPLYHFAEDQASGETKGHGVNGFGAGWYLVSPYGSLIEVEDVVSEAESAADDNAVAAASENAPKSRTALLEVGQAVFASECAVCHGAEGEGFTGPQLAGNDTLRNTQHVISQILAGSRGMPRFAGRLSNSQIAAVSTFIRGSWGNQFSTITTEEVELLSH